MLAFMKLQRKAIVLLAIGLVAVGVTTYRSTLDHLSCAGCRSVRYVASRSIFGVRFWRSERTQLSSSVPGAHVHDWWRYSLHTSTAMWTKFACKPHIFADGKDF